MPDKKIDSKQKLVGLTPAEIVFNLRNVFLPSILTFKTTQKVLTELIALDSLDKKVPIVLRINAAGGSIPCGISVIDTMRLMHAPVITLVAGEACSMASLIMVCGACRIMTKNSVLLFHPMSGGMSDDYIRFQKDRIQCLKTFNKLLNNMLAKKTNLTKAQLEKAESGELWLTAKQALKYKVVDKIV